MSCKFSLCSFGQDILCTGLEGTCQCGQTVSSIEPIVAVYLGHTQVVGLGDVDVLSILPKYIICCPACKARITYMGLPCGNGGLLDLSVSVELPQPVEVIRSPR